MTELRELVAEELAAERRPARERDGEAIAEAREGQPRRCCSTARACGEKQLDGLMLDFYLIVSDYRAAYGKRGLRPRTG